MQKKHVREAESISDSGHPSTSSSIKNIEAVHQNDSEIDSKTKLYCSEENAVEITTCANTTPYINFLYLHR